jgi:hypothetical protein
VQRRAACNRSARGQQQEQQLRGCGEAALLHAAAVLHAPLSTKPTRDACLTCAVPVLLAAPCGWDAELVFWRAGWWGVCIDSQAGC